MEKYNVRKCEMCVCDNCQRIEDMGVECLTNSLLQSPEGRQLQSKTRWGSFAWEDPHRFEQFFGPDANNFWHGPYQAREIAVPFIEFQNAYGVRKFEENDARLLIQLNVVHDIQEAVTGDIPLPEKNAASDLDEVSLQIAILSRILRLQKHDPFLLRLQEVQNGANFLSRAFKAMEYAGYLNTGLRAWAGKDNQALEPDERQKCWELGYAVLTKNVPTMERMLEFPYIQDMLLKNATAIGEARGQSV